MRPNAEPLLLPRQTSSPQRILVVDNDTFIRKFNAEVLLHSGYHTEAAVDGADAWVALNADRYDLLITDNEMPKVSGVELLMKMHTAQIALPTIMVTGLMPADEFNKYPWLRPAATIMKPYSITDLLRIVREVLRASELPRGF